MYSFLKVLCIAAPLSGAIKLSASSLQASEVQAEMAAQEIFGDAAQAFLASLAGDLSRLSNVFGSSPSAKSLLQVSNGEIPQSTKAHIAEKQVNVSDALKFMSQASPAQMPMMAGLLKDMYSTWKDKIGEANKHEQEQKAAFKKTMADLDAKKSEMKGNANATATYDRIQKYWQRQRNISHRQYHTALKIMHSGMAKFKAVEEAMQDAIAGKKPSAKDMQVIGMGAPEVVLLQEKVDEIRTWVGEAAWTVKKLRSPAAPLH